MKARELISGSSFGPDALRVLFQAFDAAWKEIGANIGDNPDVIEAARLKLADAILSVASEDSRDPIRLKREALLRMPSR